MRNPRRQSWRCRSAPRASATIDRSRHAVSPCVAPARPKAARRIFWSCHKRAALRIAQRAMRDDDLARREVARIVGIDIGFGAKKCNLKSQRFTALGRKPTRDIPPLGTKLRMAAQVFGKSQWMRRRSRARRGVPAAAVRPYRPSVKRTSGLLTNPRERRAPHPDSRPRGR